ncbi:hypothetical protein [Clostridium estertheticum]|nr:hypothetical protein [Clostridium estertheticum]
MGFFSKPLAEKIGKDLIEKCAGVCNAQIFTDWIDGSSSIWNY